MKLADYLMSKNLTLTVFAERIERSPATVSRIARGEQRPDWATIEAIRLATDGAVEPNDFFGIDTDADRPCDTEQDNAA